MVGALIDVEKSGDTSIIQRVVREDGKLYHHTRFEDDAALAKARKLADSGLIDKMALGLHDDADVRMVINCPTTEQWNIWKKENPEDYRLLTSRLEHERLQGARRLSLMHPAWVIQSRL